MSSEICPTKEEGICSRCHAQTEVVGLQVMVGEEVHVTPLLCVGCLTNPKKTIPLCTEKLEVEEMPKRVISRARRRRVAEQEREIAEAVGGRTQAGSGSVAGCKGDVRKKGLFRIECKSTEAKSFSVKREILDKIRSECGTGENPALDILFIDSATLAEEDRWVAIPFPQFEEYAEYAARNTKRPRRS